MPASKVRIVIQASEIQAIKASWYLVTETETKPGISLGAFGMILVLVSIGAFFAALAAAYYFVLAERTEGEPGHFSNWFWLSTALIVLSSGCLQRARSTLLFARFDSYRRDLWVTTAVGLAFLVTQVLGCLDLNAQGVFVAGNAKGSMYYVFTGVHGFHLLGGIGALVWLVRKARALRDGEEQPLRRHRAAARHVASYWHFMGAVWIGLFVFLLIWR
ncbi:MAG: hypothetical protein FJW38_01665 [Acidobacteria bacterium]|nr:hypothetical protein [Acidobacteriota bacterium]